MYKNIPTQTLRKPLLKSMSVTADVLRLDLLHPVISGNKWFKLKYYLSNALLNGKKGLVSFGGAYSNHLVAMAVACKEKNLLSAGIIRGEESTHANDSIQQMKDAGMKLYYVSREDYRNKEQLINNFLSEHHEYYYVPEGGKGPNGVKGASEILTLAKPGYSHIICAVGTGTTLAGLVTASKENQKVIGISSVKVEDKHSNELTNYIYTNGRKNNFTVNFDYHFGGYAKKSDELIAFMNALYNEESIATDFVYTAKMFYAVYDLVKNNHFEPGSKLLLIHTGGLQGNRSLPIGTLVF